MIASPRCVSRNPTHIALTPYIHFWRSIWTPCIQTILTFCFDTLHTYQLLQVTPFVIASDIVFPDILHTFLTRYSYTLYTYLSDSLFYTLQTVTKGIHTLSILTSCNLFRQPILTPYIDTFENFYSDTLHEFLSDILLYRICSDTLHTYQLLRVTPFVKASPRAAAAVCTYVCMYSYVCMYVCMYIHAFLYVHREGVSACCCCCMYVCMYVFICIHACMYVYACIYVCTS